MAQNTSLHTIRAPLLAPSLLLLALQSRQYTVLKEALKWYHLGLKYVRKRLKHLDIKESDDREDKFLICAALLMSFYESLNDTIVGGYEQHVLGAVALLQAKGPEIFARPEYHGLFRAIRGHAIHVSLTTGNPTCLAEEAWLSIPFFHSLKSNSEKINDILLLMPSYLFELRAKLSCITDLTESERIKNEFMQKLSHILEALDGMQIPIAQLENPSPYFSNKYYTDLDDQSLDYYRGSYSFSTAIEAKEIAMHASARIIILCILSSVTLSSSLSSASCFVIQSYYGDEDITREIEQASTSILSAAMFLSQVEIGCAYVRMVLPLQLVAQVSRNHTQRTAARTILQSWWKEKPIKGLTGLALRSIDSGSSNLLEILSV
ncbi:hypothetical protein UA08_06666 [Talaromyces atroroseus]|uniref:Uncharacterized protein n=1 Tax=Talaromyces atroroseus TaxID=1441469 RepID=A0A225AR73_TALAT|nr:hypothetical protein UA08_06666 [Talaromyces atroroseus]OKL58079.1 hypothetical protein UA08_06666 [Talaromyces atroroseus]